MADFGGEGKIIISIVVVIMLLMGGVFVYQMVGNEVSKDPLIGDWYCVHSEKYEMNGNYVTTEYSKSDFCLFTVEGVESGHLFYGNYRGTPISGYRSDYSDLIQFNGVIGGEYMITFVAKIDLKDSNMMYAVETRYVELESDNAVSVAYFTCAKDMSKVPVVGSIGSGLGSSVTGHWEIDPNYSSTITKDGETKVDGWSADFTVNGKLFRGIINYKVDDVAGESTILCALPYENSDGWRFGVSIDKDLASFFVMVKDDVMFMYSAGNKSVAFDNDVMSTQVCFVRDGAVPTGHVSEVDISGNTYKVVSSIGMLSDGKLLAGLDYAVNYVFGSGSNVLYYYESVEGPKFDGAVSCITNNSGEIISMKLVSAGNWADHQFYLTGFASMSDDYKQMVVTGASLKDGVWVSMYAVLELVDDE